MKVDGQLESATLEQLATNPSTSTQGRVYDNTTTGKTMHDNGTQKRAILKNDSKLIVGNDPTEANNVRIHKAGSGVLQDVPGDNTTPEGTSATSIAQRSTRAENLTDATLPAAGNPGRHAFLTDQKVLAEDDGSAWRKHIAEYSANDSTAGGTIALAPITSSVVRLTGSFSTLNMIPAGFPSQRVTLINRSGADVVISHDSGATPADRIYTGTGANLTFKNNSSLPLYYDAITQRWQVVGETAGATASGGGVPNSTVITVTSDYTVLVTDDIILADTSNGPINITLPTPAGNLGLRVVIEKIGSQQANKVTVIGTINGITNEDIWPLYSPYEVVSDGAEWKTVSSASALDVFLQSPDPSTFVPVVAVSTTNIVLENMSLANFTSMDNIRPNGNQRFILKNQTVPEENGVYLMPATPISIQATATGNEDISTLAAGSVVNSYITSAGDKVSLRFQTNPNENGIYVIGATPGTTVRDTSLRDPSYVTAQSLRNFVAWADVYNYPIGNVSFAAIEISTSHVNDRRFWAQTNNNASSFSDLTFIDNTLVPISYTIKVPSNAKQVSYEVCPMGGSGSGGRNAASGGGGGAGVLPIFFSRNVDPGSTITVPLPISARPGSGRAPSQDGVSAPPYSIVQSSPSYSFYVFGPGGGTATGGSIITGLSGLPAFSAGGNPNAVGTRSYFTINETKTAGAGGVYGGGGGGDGLSAGGNGGAGNILTSGYLGGFGGFGRGFGAGGGGGGAAPGSGRPGRGGFPGPCYVKLSWR